jgi:Trypsin-like peptidase domain
MCDSVTYAFLGIMVLGAFPLRAQQLDRHLESRQIVAALRRATVTVEAHGVGGQSTGSGFVVTKDGLIVTAAHVIRGMSSASVRLASGESYEVRGLVSTDTTRDFALLRIPGFDLPVVVLGNSDSVSFGDRLVAVGAPLGLEATVTDGILSSKRLVNGVQWLQMSVPVSPGSSGGPVANDQGQVVGVVVAAIVGGEAQNLNFALPINYVRGAIALGTDQPPRPLGSSRLGEGTPSLAKPGGMDSLPKVVNRSALFDWRRLDQVTVYVECDTVPGLPKYRVAYSQSYRTGTSPTGRPTLETHELERIFTSANNCPYSRYADAEGETEALVFLDSIGGYHVVTELRNLKDHTSLRSEIDIRDSTFTIAGDRGPVAAKVPLGTIPKLLLGPALAALPDELPSQIYIWTVDSDSASSRIEPIQVRRDVSGTARVRIREGNKPCEFGDEGNKQDQLATRTLRITSGARRWDMTVLALQPHLEVTKRLKCLTLPGR